MNTIYGILLLSFAVELLLFFQKPWTYRNHIVWLLLGMYAVTAIMLLRTGSHPYTFFTLLVLAFRAINIVRLLYGRRHESHIKNIIRRSLLWLIGLQFLSALLTLITESNVNLVILYLSSTQFLSAGLLLGFIVHSVHQTRFDGHSAFLSDKELPSITVAIPARNETQDLASCIESILGTNYPKLEVLVLDDCSQDKTPDIIKHYAHAGVRFLEGSEPKKDWLAKNQAYQQLATEANGSYIVFCGVDVRMAPDYLRNLVTHTIVKKKNMVSVLPLRLGGDIRSSFIQPMRYWWELALPRKFLNRPAVLSTCWIIKKKTLLDLGSFNAVRRNILPERYFARECVAQEAYGLVRSNEKLDLRTVKSPHAQFLTSIRVRYPQFQKRPENILILTVVLQILLFMPYLLFALTFFVDMPEVRVISATTIAMLALAHAIIISVSNPANSLIALVNFPFVIMSETILTMYSMLQYEFGKIMWKGRNVCIPVHLGSISLPRLRRR